MTLFHYVHVVHVDPERAAALGKAFTLVAVAFLVWHFVPQGWSMLDGWMGGWLGTMWHVVTIPFVLLGHIPHFIASTIAWVIGGVDSAFRIAAMVQAVLLPVWAMLAGCCIGRANETDAAILWLGAAGLNALCAVLLGFPLLGGMVVVGSLAAFVATSLLASSPRDWAGWLAAALVAGLSAWGMERYAMAFQPVCWLLVPLSWCCLLLGAAYVVRPEAGIRLRDRKAVRLVTLAMVMATAAIGPSGADAVRAAGLLPGVQPPVPTLLAPAIVTPAPPMREVVGGGLPTRQPNHVGAARRNGQDVKPAFPSHSVHPRT